MANKSKRQERVGEVHSLKDGSSLEIIEYFTCENVTVRFSDGSIVYNKRYDHIKEGSVKNPYQPSVCGVGYMGVGKYNAFSQKTKLFKNYQTWSDALKRCYSKRVQENQPTYGVCSVHPEWHNFQNFGEWFEDNYKPHMEGWELDKDILFKGNKIYSPETCCFVPHVINKLFTRRENRRGDCPIGVNRKGLRYEAWISKGEKHQIFLGTYNSSEKAFQAYKVAKESWIKEVADEWKPLIEPQVYDAMYAYQVEITD